jgi:hypothetical protein
VGHPGLHHTWLIKSLQLPRLIESVPIESMELSPKLWPFLLLTLARLISAVADRFESQSLAI